MFKKTEKTANFSLRDLTSRYQLDFYNYWHKLRGNRSFPSRADIKPSDIVKILPFITLLEKRHNDFQVRLIGTCSTTIFGEITGQFLSKIGYEACTLNQLRRCANMGQASFNVNPVRLFSNRHYNSSALAMPLSDNDREINMVIVVHDFY